MKKLVEWYSGDVSIRKKLIISYLLLVLVPVLVLGLYSYHISKKNLLEHMRQSIEENVASITYNLNSSIQRENDNIKYLSYNARFREKLENCEEDYVDLAKELTTTVEPIFWYFITSDDNIKSIKVYSPCINRAIGSFLIPMKEYEDEEWYDANKQDFATHWFYEDNCIYATRVLLDEGSSSEPIGLIKLEVYPNHIVDSILQFNYLNNGVILLDDKKTIIGETDTNNQSLTEAIHSEIYQVEEPGFYETNDYLMFVSERLINGWQLFYYIDKREITTQINSILIRTSQVIGICLVATLILIGMLSKVLSSRILRLKEVAEQVSQGDFEVSIYTNSSDEIGIVENSFINMSSRIREMMDEMYKLGLEKRAEELKALQAMINPHFLYNCLSSIKWKAIMAEQDEIAEITGQIAKFYRTSLNGGKQITTVKNELDNIKAYLEIQSRTHENNFDIEYIIDETGMDYNMPNFLLQPIVENAICHGIDHCAEGLRGFIKVEYICKDKCLLFKIYNNGPVMDQESIERILTTPGKGYGIYNIRERIRMYYDDPTCGLFVNVTENDLVCFTVKLGKVPKTT